MAMRKITLMHKIFGITEGHTCRECSNLSKMKLNGRRSLCKCSVYGITQSDATDWAGRWQACGAFNRTICSQPAMWEVVPEKKPVSNDTPMEGQISFEV